MFVSLCEKHGPHGVASWAELHIQKLLLQFMFEGFLTIVTPMFL